MAERYRVLPPDTPGIALHAVPGRPGPAVWKAPPITPPSALDPCQSFRMRPQLVAASSVTVPTVPARARNAATGTAASSHDDMPRAKGMSRLSVTALAPEGSSIAALTPPVRAGVDAAAGVFTVTRNP